MELSYLTTIIPGRKSILIRLLSVMFALSVISGGIVLLGILSKFGTSGSLDLATTGLNYFLLIIPFSCVTSFLVAERFTEPIFRLIEGTKAASRGDFNYNIEIKTGDEIEELANTFTESRAEIESFIYTVSHDLKSPLVTIQGFADLLDKDIEANEQEKVERDLWYIKEGIAKMDRILTDTIKLSHIDPSKKSPEYVSFGKLVHEAREKVHADLQEKGVEVSVAGDFPLVHVDPLQVVEMITHLIENSINNMENQLHPKIEIGCLSENDETVFFVRDNGRGIEPSQQRKVFGLYYKLDRNSEHTGMGLAIVKRIIDIHRGRIWIESEKDNGCTVYFTLSPCAA